VFSSPWSLEFVLAVVIGAMLVPGCRPAEDGTNSGPRHELSSGPAMRAQPSNHEPAIIGKIPWSSAGINGPTSSIYSAR
jgi:hypothetical protein